MNKKTIWWTVGAVVVIAGFWLLVVRTASAETLSCPAGQKVEAVEITPAVIEVPAVTHIEVVVDSEAYDEVVVDSPAYTSCEYVGYPAGDYYTNACTTHGVNLFEVYKKVNHPAVTHTVHHEAVTHEEVIVDVPAVESVPAVYEDQCVTDPDYVAPVVKSSAPASSQQGGSGRCDRYGKPTCTEFFAKLGIPYGNPTGSTGDTDLLSMQKKLLSLLQQLVVLLQK